jgi:hypothetical protein
VGVNVTKAQLIKYICNKEGKKHQASIGDIREIISIIEDLIAEELVSLSYDLSDDISGIDFFSALSKSINKKVNRIVRVKYAPEKRK